MNAAQARQLATLAKSEQLFLMEAMWMKFHPAIEALQESVASGAIGEVRYLHAGFGFSAPRDPSSRFWSADEGGGALLDMGVYPITLAHLLLGHCHLEAALGDIRDDGIDTRAMATLASANAVAQTAVSIEHAIPPSAAIAGETGFILIDLPFWAPGSFQVFPNGLAPGAPEPTTISATAEGVGYVPMFRETSKAVLDGEIESAVHPLSATIDVLELVDQVRQALLDQKFPNRVRPMDPWETEDLRSGSL